MEPLRDLWNVHHAALHRFATHLSGNTVEADDLVSETFVRLWTSSTPIRMDTVRGYLFAILRNLHRRRRRQASRSEALVDDIAADRPGVDEDVIQQQEAARVRRAIAAMDDDDRAALLMRVDGELSYEDIGRTLGISAGAARVRVHRARRRLIGAVREEGIDASHP